MISSGGTQIAGAKILSARAIPIVGLVLIGLSVWQCVPAVAADLSPSERARLQASLEAARPGPGGDRQLDAAYELLAVADTATKGGGTDIAASATAALISVIDNAGLTGSGTVDLGRAQDAIDQLLDLKFSAGSAGLDSVLSAIDRSMRRLFLVVEGGLSKAVSAGDDFDSRLQSLAAMADLQASAAQANLAEEAATIGRSFDIGFQELSEEAHTVTGSDRIAALDGVRTSREERLADAVANNVQTVAAELRSAEQSEGADLIDESTDVGETLDNEEFVEDSICVETGVVGEPASPLAETLQRACVLAGHTALVARCPMRDLSFVCYRSEQNAESIVYVYRGTPEEETMRLTCGADNIVESGGVPADGAPFRGPAVNLALTCAPIGERAERN